MVLVALHLVLDLRIGIHGVKHDRSSACEPLAAGPHRAAVLGALSAGAAGASARRVFHDKAQGSLLTDAKGKPIGSRLIAQPFTADEYFQPRPSAASYNAAASGASNWAASNYLLRDRVARQLGPIVKYRSGPKKGQPSAPTSKAGSRRTSSTAKPGIVAQWASAALRPWPRTGSRPTSSTPPTWPSGRRRTRTEVAAVDQGQSRHAGAEARGPGRAVLHQLLKAHPGTFPSAVEHKTPDGKTEKQIEPVKEGSDIQAGFFDMWLQAHPDADLEHVPADMVMASGSGLDPHITLGNALWQLDRVAAAWAKKTGGDEAKLHGRDRAVARQKSFAPLGGLVGVPLVNVLEINLALGERYQKPSGTVAEK